MDKYTQFFSFTCWWILDYFHFLTTVNKVKMNTGIQVSICFPFPTLVSINLVEFLSYIITQFSFLRNCHINFCSGHTNFLPIIRVWGFTSLPVVFDISWWWWWWWLPPRRFEVVSHCSFDLYLSNDNDVKNFHVFIDYLKIFFTNVF